MNDAPNTVPGSSRRTRPAAPRVRFIARTVVPLALLGGAALLLVATGIDAWRPTPEVRVAPVVMLASAASGGDLSADALQAPGWIEPAPHAHQVRALRDGIVEKVAALEGARVETGEVLATLLRPAETLALEEAEAALRAAEAEAEGARRAASTAQQVFELAIEPERRLAAAKAALDEAEAMLARLDAEIREAELVAAETRDEAEQKRRLAASGGASEGEVRRLSLRAEALAARVEALRHDGAARRAKRDAAVADHAAATAARRLLLDERRLRDEAQSLLAHAEAELSAARARRALAAFAVEASEVRAPCDGVVLVRNAAPGAHAALDGAALFELYDPQSLQVRCDVPLRDAARLAIGLAAEVRVDALPDRTFAGTLERIVPLGDLQKNTVQCKIRIADPHEALRPDMLARVRIAAGGATRGVPGGERVAVPIEALRERSDRRAEVLVVMPDGTASRTERRSLELADERGGGWIEVVSGLAAGDRVVLDPAVREAMRVRPIERPHADAPDPAAEGATP